MALAQGCGLGRKVFFVDPPSVVEDQMIHFLVTAQYEVAIVKNPRSVQRVLTRFPCSIVYFNLDSRFPPGELEKVVRAVVGAKEQLRTDVGVVSYNENPEAARLYLMEIGATCGYVTLSLGFKQSARIIVRALEAAEARGKRRFVRVKPPPGRASLNVGLDGSYMAGRIIDLSIAGVACSLEREFTAGSVLEDIQLQLWGTLAKVSGKIAGVRGTGPTATYVITFDEIQHSGMREKIYGFLTRVMQHEADEVAGA